MGEEQYLTAEGAAALRAELEELIKVKRPQLAERLREAIGQGDLSENADYSDAKEQQAFLEGRILYLEMLLRQDNQGCWGPNPSCADCLWAQDIVRCP